ncbi:hypothetical protein, partial [Lacticaseibacillus paracasei]|uniref:hypothetical protein n=1 Tax=Lacticaseibacillus paracasei TaxID=1597 RepID=UPI000A9A3891
KIRTIISNGSIYSAESENKILSDLTPGKNLASWISDQNIGNLGHSWHDDLRIAKSARTCTFFRRARTESSTVYQSVWINIFLLDCVAPCLEGGAIMSVEGNYQ